ncbi:MAG: DUF4231 domain-containing protein [Candidatus Hodarchaeota archaeon]
MEDKKFEEYWKGRYEGQIQWYEKKSARNKKRYQYLQLSLIILSALTPLLIAIDFAFKEFDILQWISIVTSVTIAILASSLRIFKFQEHWVNYRTTAELLKKEQHLFEANTSGYDKVQDKRALFVKRVEGLISVAHTEWVEKYQTVLGSAE